MRHLSQKEHKLPNPFMHVELLSTDMTKAQDFYSQIFNWTFRDIPRAGNPYTMIDVGEGTGGNLVESPLAESNPFWLAYVAVQDMTQTLEAVLANGGTIVRDQAQEPGMGSFAIIKDPMGATLGLWQAP